MQTLKEKYSDEQLQAVKENKFCYHAIEKADGTIVPIIIKEGINEPIELPIYWGAKLETVLCVTKKMNMRHGITDKEVEKMIKNTCLS